MPTKRVPKLPTPTPAPIQEPELEPELTPEPKYIFVTVQPPIIPPQIILEGSMALRKIIQTMRNGAYSMQPGYRPFTPHPGLMQSLRRAYDRNDRETFEMTVRSYLEQAVKILPHAGTPGEIDTKMTDLHYLIGEIGLHLVGQRILAVIGAPL